MKKIVMTGGGTAGHVTPNIALFPSLRERGYQIYYIGSYKGIEKELIEAEGDILYYGISSGRFRRYFSLQNLVDPFKVLHGISQARQLLKKIQPDIVFSKGGFVSVPVVLAAGKLNIPTIIHESDMTPGLANRISSKYASRICYSFPETLDSLPAGRAVFSGSPIRQELLTGDREKGLALCGFNQEKPVLLIIGGSTGAKAINDTVRSALPEILKKWQVIHLCGKGMLDPSLNGTTGYVQFEYVREDLRHLFAAADLVVSRAGANAICELLALKKPNILIPLSAAASRGDQILNAASYEKQGYSYVIQEEALTVPSLLKALDYVQAHMEDYRSAMEKSPATDAVKTICDLIDKLS